MAPLRVYEMTIVGLRIENLDVVLMGWTVESLMVLHCSFNTIMGRSFCVVLFPRFLIPLTLGQIVTFRAIL